VTIFKSQSCIDHLNKRYRVTSLAISLIMKWASEIVILNVSKVVFFRDESFVDFLWLSVLLSPRLSIFYCVAKRISLLTKLLLSTLLTFLKSRLYYLGQFRVWSPFITLELCVTCTQLEISSYLGEIVVVESTRFRILILSLIFVFLGIKASNWVFSQTALFIDVCDPARHCLITN